MVRILDLPEPEIVPCCCPVLAIMGFEDQRVLDPFHFLLNREQLSGRRVRFNDDQRRRLAVKAKTLGRRVLAEIATLVTPETAFERRELAAAQSAAQGTARIARSHFPPVVSISG
jgi:hypothetical protein